MSEQNQKIRKFQDMIHSFKQGKKIADGKALHNNQNVMQTVEDEIAHYNAQIHMMEQMCVEELNIHQKVLKELASLDRKLVLTKAVMDETKELQELARRVAESEKAYASSVEQLQRYACPNCGVDNMGDSVLAVLEEGGN
ncbi:hypothetical protein QJS04_geneDACA023536 [Acorus gramineus]|uniref:Uncharacterized protein n=1 Tax=Acorus gramineus TaxID=55184 RepID=A0AAV9BBQ6_ACOGR|nr:hypothetical protein QJS04_geneDACA023536 [Acorus gramineus]